MQTTISIFKKGAVQRKRHPKVEDMIETLKLIIKNKVAMTGLVITVAYMVLALLDVIYPAYLGYGPNTITSLTQLLPPGTPLGEQLPTPPTFANGWHYWFGTTVGAYPLFPAILASLRIDLGYSLVIVLTGAIVGILVGTFSGYFGGVWDELMMRITDVFYSIPFLVMAIAFTTILSYTLLQDHVPVNGFNLIALALIIIWWPTYARLTRSITLSLKSSRFIEAAVASGSSRVRNVVTHIIPGVLSPVFVQISLDLGSIVLVFATLEFLGLGAIIQINSYTPELGNLITIGQTCLVTGDWWPIFIPGVFLLIFTVGINIFGDGMRDVLDPKMRR